jgi:uncharacterized protein YpbB
MLIDGSLLKIPKKHLLPLPKTEKVKKGDSAKLSLELFGKGKTVAEIAEERNLKESTIMEHLSRYVSSGKVPVFALVSKEKVEKILPLLNAESQASAPVKEKLGDDVSYEEIRAVIRHYSWINKG